MNCVPVPTLPFVPAAAAVVAAGGGAATVAAPVATAIAADWEEKNASAAILFGVALPWPQPPSRVWAITGPAHKPLLKPQQEDAQSASELHGPVMNCVPAERARGARVEKRRIAFEMVVVYIFGMVNWTGSLSFVEMIME